MTAVNYSPLVLLVGVIVAIWWQLGAKNRYKGPVRTIDNEEFGHVIEPPTDRHRAGRRRRLGIGR